MIFDKEKGKPKSMSKNDTWIAYFNWEIFYSFNLSELITLSKQFGGKIEDETGRIVFDPGFNFDFNKFKEL